MKITFNAITQKTVQSIGKLAPSTMVHGVCMELLKYIADGSVDMVLTDPPFINSIYESVSISPNGKLLKELKRIVKPNGLIITIAPTRPKQVPISLSSIEILIKTYSKKKDIILDYRMGEGSIGLACQNLDRKYIGIESDKKAFDVACGKVENYQSNIIKSLEKKKLKVKKEPKVKEPKVKLPKKVKAPEAPVEVAVEVVVKEPVPEFKGIFEQLDMFE